MLACYKKDCQLFPPIRYVGMEDDQKIQMAFTKKQVEARKDWLTQGMLERRERREAGEFLS